MDLIEEIIEYLEANYDEDHIAQLIDEAMIDYIDDDWDDDYETEHDWYIDHGNGEAEEDVMNDIIFELKTNFNFTDNFYFDEYGETIDDLIKEHCELLNK